MNTSSLRTSSCGELNSYFLALSKGVFVKDEMYFKGTPESRCRDWPDWNSFRLACGLNADFSIPPPPLDPQRENFEPIEAPSVQGPRPPTEGVESPPWKPLVTQVL